MELRPLDQEDIVRVAVSGLEHRFEAIGRDRIEATVRRTVGELWGGSRVTSFVGIIAERRAREELRQFV